MRHQKALALLLTAMGWACKSADREPEGSAPPPLPAAPSAAPPAAVAGEPGSYFWLAGEKIERRRAFAPDVLEVKLDAAGVKTLPPGSAGKSAAGDRMVFVAGSGLWELRAVDSAPRKLLDSPELAKAPLSFRGLSPSGRWAAYVTQVEAPAKSSALFIDIEKKQVLVRGGLSDVRGFIDEGSVLAGETGDKSTRLFAYDIGSQKRRLIAELPPDSRLDAVSPPRNNRIAYAKRSKRDGDMWATLFYRPLGGGEEQQLCVDTDRQEINGPLQNVELSPSGEQVLFTSYTPGKAREIAYTYPVVVADLASKSCRRLEMSPLFYETTWLSNAEVVMRHASGHVRVVHVSDGRKFGPLVGGSLVRAF